MNIHYRVKVEPLDGAGSCIIEDLTTARPSETAEACVRREAAEAGWRVVELIEANSIEAN